MTVIQTTPGGVHNLVSSPKSLDSHPTRWFTKDITKTSTSRLVCVLAKDTVSWRKSLVDCPNLQELADKVIADNEMAASELGLLGEYRYTLHCMTN